MANAIDTKIIGKLADVLNKNNLSELEYEDESCRIKIKGLVVGCAAPVSMAPVATPADVFCHKKETCTIKPKNAR